MSWRPRRQHWSPSQKSWTAINRNESTESGQPTFDKDGLMEVSVPLPIDEDGYLDRECPFDACLGEFKIHGDDWNDKVSDDKVYCPWCRHETASDKWFTQAQLKYGHRVVERQAHKYMMEELKYMADNFNRSQRSSIISMRLELKSSNPPRMLPCEVAKIMEQRFQCTGCQCRFASVGASFFCPACGLDSVPNAFRASLVTVRRSVTDAIAVLDRTFDRDAAADLGRLVTEGAVVRLVAAHQRHTEALFTQAYGSIVKFPKNVFQRLADASTLWKDQAGFGYEDLLTAKELERLRLFFQRRHLLEHKDGLVDAEYITKSNDTAWSPGQRLVVTADDVLELALLVETLANGIEGLPRAGATSVP